MAGSVILDIHRPGSSKKSGREPEAGSKCIFEENNKINKTASQNEGVAIAAIVKTRIN